MVAERLGFEWAEALTMGRAVAGLNAYAKGKALGIFHPKPAAVKEKRKVLKHGEQLSVNLLERAVPVLRTPEGLRAISKDRSVAPESVERYLESKFGAGYEAARRAMTTLKFVSGGRSGRARLWAIRTLPPRGSRQQARLGRSRRARPEENRGTNALAG